METEATSVSWVPASCTLPTVAQPVRIAEFDRFFAESVLRATRPHEARLELLLDADAEALARELAEKESACCSFFTFTFEPSGEGITMAIEVPPTHIEVLDAVAARLAAD